MVAKNMKKTKTYRAPTLREALEKIKQELGENAMIVGHKRVPEDLERADPLTLASRILPATLLASAA